MLFTDGHVFARPDYMLYASEFLGGFAGDFDLDAIADDLMEELGGRSPDDMCADDFHALVQRRDVSGKGPRVG